MKRILELLILIAVIASIGALTGCSPHKEEASGPPPRPEPPPAHDVLREQVEHERQLRASAEARTEEASADADFWRATAALLSVGLCAAFIGGTAIGSKGKKHARP